MKIKSIEPIAVSLPMIKPVVMAAEVVRRGENMLVRIQADNSLVGWGEAAAAPTMTGETLESMACAVNFIAPVLRDREAADIEGALTAMHGRMYGNHGAKAAIEIALHDLAGQAAGKPVHALLGPRKRSRLPLLTVIGGGDLDGDLRDAEQKKAAGFTAFKIKVGVDAAENDAARTRAICRVLGEDVLISADANEGYSTEEATRYVRSVGDAGLSFFEQPVAADDLTGMATVAAAADGIAIGADEGIHSLADIRRHHECKAARGAGLKAIKLGGVSALVEAAALCDSLDMRVNISCKTGESSIACAAALHAAAVVPNVDWALTLTHTALAEDVTETPLATAHGYAAVTDGRGLGVTVDEARLQRYRVPIAVRAIA